MALMKCESCGGVYETDQERQTRYFHACPPIEVVTVDRAGAIVTVPREEVQPDDKPIRAKVIPRPDGRDENVVVVDHKVDGTAVAAIKSEGKGVTPIDGEK